MNHLDGIFTVGDGCLKEMPMSSVDEMLNDINKAVDECKGRIFADDDVTAIITAKGEVLYGWSYHVKKDIILGTLKLMDRGHVEDCERFHVPIFDPKTQGDRHD